MKNKIAYCGLNCEKCDAYIATVNDDNGLREKTARYWSELNGITITAEQINCMGCREEGVKTEFCDKLCPIRLCAKERGVDTCGGCQKLSDCETVKMITATNGDALKNLLGNK